MLKYIPNLLTMENKTDLFWKEIDKIKSYEYFEPTINRESIFIDSFNKFIYLTPKELKGEFKIQFENELGYDAGGLRRDFFTSISK